MERTYPPKYNPNEEPIVLSKPLIDLLLQEREFSNLLSLYSFYYYTAKWQGTDQPKATLQYVSAKIGWCLEKVQKVKNALEKLGLIESIVTRGEGNKILGHFVKVNFIWNDSRPLVFPDLEKTMRKCLYKNIYTPNKNSLGREREKPSAKERNTQYIPIAENLSRIIQKNKNISHTSKQVNSWANDIRRLVEENSISISRIKLALRWYSQHIGEAYVPVIESGSSLREKFLRLENKINKQDLPNLPSHKYDDNGRRYNLGKDGRYYHCRTGEELIE